MKTIKVHFVDKFNDYTFPVRVKTWVNPSNKFDVRLYVTSDDGWKQFGWFDMRGGWHKPLRGDVGYYVSAIRAALVDAGMLVLKEE